MHYVVSVATQTTPTSIKLSPSCLRLTVSSKRLLYHCSSLDKEETTSPDCSLETGGAVILYCCSDSCNDDNASELSHN